MLQNTPLALALLAVLGSSAAQTSVVSILLPGFDQQSIQVSVIAAVPEATTYLANCPSGTPSDQCGLGKDVTFINGPSTWEMHATDLGGFKLDAECDIVTSNVATCTQSYQGGESSSQQSTQSIDVLSDIKQYYGPVRITAGLEKLSPTPGSSPSNAAASTTSRTSSTPNAAFPQKTQNAVLAGVAAVMGGVLML